MEAFTTAWACVFLLMDSITTGLGARPHSGGGKTSTLRALFWVKPDCRDTYTELGDFEDRTSTSEKAPSGKLGRLNQADRASSTKTSDASLR